MLESISSTKICRISCENPLSPPENIARIGFRKSKVVANPKTPQIISVANTVPKTFKARSLLPPPIFCRIIAAPPSPILPAGTVDTELILLETPSAPTVCVPYSTPSELTITLPALKANFSAMIGREIWKILCKNAGHRVM